MCRFLLRIERGEHYSPQVLTFTFLFAKCTKTTTLAFESHSPSKDTIVSYYYYCVYACNCLLYF